MAFVAVDKDGKAYIFKLKPIRYERYGIWLESDPINDWHVNFDIGYLDNMRLSDLKWDDEPIEI